MCLRHQQTLAVPKSVCGQAMAPSSDHWRHSAPSEYSSNKLLTVAHHYSWPMSGSGWFSRLCACSMEPEDVDIAVTDRGWLAVCLSVCLSVESQRGGCRCPCSLNLAAVSSRQTDRQTYLRLHGSFIAAISAVHRFLMTFIGPVFILLTSLHSISTQCPVHIHVTYTINV